jgi:hypothetical protein
LVRRLVLLLALVAAPATAHAQKLQGQVLVIPFFGYKFKGHTNIVDPANPKHPGGATKTTFGGSVDLLSPGIFGVEADFEHTPHFFDTGLQGLTVQSSVSTLVGNAVFAVPLAITQESLRPYVLGGLGWMHASNVTQAHVLDTNSNLLALDVGGGAIGFLTPRAGVRFDVRHFKNLSNDRTAVTFGNTRLSYWRLSIGVVLR